MRPQNTGSTIGPRAPVHHGVVPNEFKPGHPVLFWFFIVILIFGFISGTKALITRRHLQDPDGGRQALAASCPPSGSAARAGSSGRGDVPLIEPVT